jgi:hypothetical protein
MWNLDLLANCTHEYICEHMCVFVCVCVYSERESEIALVGLSEWTVGDGKKMLENEKY